MSELEHSAEMRRCLIECDVAAARKLWHHIAPKAPAPKTDTEALVTIHYARTKSALVNLRLRSYSHHWLIDRGYPSGLPDNVREKADRLYPHIADAVGIAVYSSFPEAAKYIQRAMNDAVEDCYADNRREPDYVKPRVGENKIRAKKELHGILSEAAERDLRQRTLKSLRNKRDDT